MQTIAQAMPKFPAPGQETRPGIRKTIWVDVGEVGQITHHKNLSVFWTTDLATEFSQETNLLVFNIFDGIANFDIATNVLGDHVNIKREHRSDGSHNGEVVGFRYGAAFGAGDFLQAELFFSNDDLRVDYNKGLIREFSPAIKVDYKHVHSGQVLTPFITEVSFTSDAHQRNLRDPVRTNPGVTLSKDGTAMPPNPNTTTQAAFNAVPIVNNAAPIAPPATPVATMAEDGAEAPPEVLEMIAAVDAKIDMVLEILAGKAMPDPAAGDLAADKDDEDDSQMARINDLESALTRTIDDRTRDQLVAMGITENLDPLVALSRTDSVLYGVVTAELCRCNEAAPVASTPVARTRVAGVGLGRADVSAQARDAALVASEAFGAGVRLSKEGSLSIFLNKTNQISDHSAIRRELKRIEKENKG